VQIVSFWGGVRQVDRQTPRCSVSATFRWGVAQVGDEELEERIGLGQPVEAPPVGELVIAASQLRRIILSSKVTSAGIVILGDNRIVIQGDAETDGSIDLSYLAGRDGGPLPPLVLEGCQLRGTFRLTGSHVAFLSLDGCAFSRIDADHCRIDNHCRLINLRAIEQGPMEPIAQIRMVAARIDGTADMRNSKLRAPRPKGRPVPRSYADRYALSLASAAISGRLLLDDNFEALGGVSLYQATIGNSVSIRTAKLESRLLGTPALDAEELRLAGTLLWTNPAPAGAVGLSDWHVAGEVVLRHAHIEGDCSFEHCRWAGAGAESILPDMPVDHICGGLDLRFAQVGGQFALCAGCVVAQGNAPPPRRKEEDWLSGIFGPSVDAWKAHFGKGVRIECDARFAGPVLLNGTDIGHELIFRGDVAVPMPPVALPAVPEALDLSGAHVRGLVRIWGVFSGCVRMHGATVDGTVQLQDLTFSLPPLTPGDPEQDMKRGLATLLDLSATKISGALHIGNINLATACEESPVERLQASLAGAKVRSLLPLQVGDGRLMQFFFEDGLSGIVFLGRAGPELFEGTHDQFLDLSSQTLPLAAPEEVSAFLDLYFRTAAGVLGPSGAFTLGKPEQQGPEWSVPDCEFLYAGCWYKTEVHVDSGGEVWFEGDRPIPRAPTELRDLERIGPFTRVAPEDLPAADALCDPDSLLHLRAAVNAYFASRSDRPLILDLRGVDCRTFNDMQGMAWQWLGPQRHWRLLLDGISFTHFEDVDPKSRWRREPKRLAGPPRQDPGVATPEAPRQARIRRIQMLLAFVDAGGIRGWRGLEAAAASRSFSPHPFQIFARAYRQSGNHFLAVGIILSQRRLQWTRSSLDIAESIGRRMPRILSAAGIYAGLLGLASGAASASAGLEAHAAAAVAMLTSAGLWLLFIGLAWTWPAILLGVGRLFDFTFGFGLKPRRALITFGICLFFGIIATSALDSLRPVSRSAPAGEGDATRVQTAVEGCNTAGDSFADRAIYAFDVFVPLIDVREECAFVIDEDAWFLRMAKAAYAALGWLVVSLMLLTFSGVLRRDIEN
jgi:hypothetical protein